MSQTNQELRYDSKLHADLLEVGRTIEKGITHSLGTPFVETIISTLEYYGASYNQLQVVAFDLVRAKYKIYDWLGMAYTGRLDQGNDSVQKCIENMVKLYVAQKNVGGFAWWLRGHDLDIEEPKFCKDCIDSYKEYQEDMKRGKR